MTQTEEIIKALKGAGKEGLHPTYFIVDLHIYQYNARIHELRELFGCTCKHSNSCSAKEHIKNKTLPNGTTVFIYTSDVAQNSARMKQYMKEYQDDKDTVVLEQSELF